MQGPRQASSAFHVSVPAYRESSLFIQACFFSQSHGSKTGNAAWPRSECPSPAHIEPLGKEWGGHTSSLNETLAFFQFDSNFYKAWQVP